MNILIILLLTIVSCIAYIEPSEDPEYLRHHNLPFYHFSMMQDQDRNNAYYHALKDAIIPNKSIVLDLGSGAGMLSFFAYKLHAKKVISIERSKFLCELQEEIMKLNNISSKDIEVINAESYDLRLGINGKYRQIADILVSETLDSWIIGEGFLDSLVDLRSRKLIDVNAIIIPHKASMYLQLVETNHLFHTEDAIMYGINYSPMRKYKFLDGITENSLETVVRNLSSVHYLFDYNFLSYGNGNLLKPPFVSLSIPITQSGMLHGVTMWFDACIDQACRYPLNNAPGSSTHWYQMTRLFNFNEKMMYESDIFHLLVSQISQRYLFANERIGERILKIESFCDDSMDLYQRLHEEDVYVFNLEYGAFNVWLTAVNEVFIAIPVSRNQKKEINDQDHVYQVPSDEKQSELYEFNIYC